MYVAKRFFVSFGLLIRKGGLCLVFMFILYVFGMLIRRVDEFFGFDCVILFFCDFGLLVGKVNDFWV